MKLESLLPLLWGDRKGEPDPFRALRKQMDDLFNDWSGDLGRASPASLQAGFAPRINVSETDKELTVTADLPGVEQKDIEVTLVGDTLSIRGEKRHEAEDKKDEEGRRFHRVERSYGSFQRVLSVPFDIDPGKVAASFKDGVLKVTLPKPPEVQRQAKKIEVKQGA